MGDIIEIETSNNLEYVFFPVSSSHAVRFKVKAINDAHIALTRRAFESEPITEIHIGAWDNTKSIVRRNMWEPGQVKVETPNILNPNEYVGMWVTWYNNSISAGLEGSDTPFISYEDPSPHDIEYIMAVRTGWGSCGSWKIEVTPVIVPTLEPKPISSGQLHWVSMSEDDPLPADAVIGGFEGQERVYVARASHRGSLCPGKYVPSLRHAVIPWGYWAHTKTRDFEILCGYDYLWIKTKKGILPPHAFPGGVATETYNKVIYIGRAYVDTHLIPGKVHLHYQTCYIPHGRFEKEVEIYEVLVCPPKMPRQVIWYQKFKDRIPEDS